MLDNSGTFTTFDLDSYRLQALAFQHGDNIYLLAGRYPYPPVWIWIIGAIGLLADPHGARFTTLARMPATLADLATLYLLFVYARQRLGPCLWTLLPVALFALNPLAALISSGHGQFDSLVMLFVLLAIVVRGPEQEGAQVASALLLGVAIALKGFPVLFLPYFIFSAPGGRRILVALLSGVPLLASMAVFVAVFGFRIEMLQHMLNYASTPDFGWGYLTSNGILRVSGQALGLLSTASRVAIVAFAVAAPLLLHRRRPLLVLSAIFGFFTFAAVNFSVQYLLWGLAVLCVASPPGALMLTAAGTVAALGFYAADYATVIPSDPPWRALAALVTGGWTAGVEALIGLGLLLVVWSVAAGWDPRPWLRLGPGLPFPSPSFVSLDVPSATVGRPERA